MKTSLIESKGSDQKVYESLLLEPKHLGIFSNELALQIVAELAKRPLCAMDIAKRLKENEQKIYYHLRKMKDAGIVRLNGTEQRIGMTAKLFELVSPVISTKLYEGGYETTSPGIKDPEIENFLKPFIANQKLNAEIILGSPTLHGKYEATARDGVYAIDLALFLGKFINGSNVRNYRIDVEASEKDLKNNLILIGNPKINSITDRINSEFPLFFDIKKDWAIKSKLTGNTYNYDDDAVIVRVKNPFDKRKEIILLAGRRSRGLRSAIIAFTRHTNEVMKGNIENGKIIAKVVRGVDKDGDGVIDTVTFLE